MAKRRELVELTEKDIKEAIDNWLRIKYGPFNPEATSWTIFLRHQDVYDEAPVYQAQAEREVD